MLFGPLDEPMPEVEISPRRLDQMLHDIKRNSRNRRIAMVAPVLLAAAVVAATIAAPPQHGGLALVAEAEGPDPQLPRVFGSNGVWRLAEPIVDAPADSLSDPGPASIIEAPTESDSPSFALSPPTEEEINSLPASTSTPPMSTSGQSPAVAESSVEDPAELDWSKFGAAIRIEPVAADTVIASDTAVAGDPAPTTDAEESEPSESESSVLESSESEPSESEISETDTGETVPALEDESPSLSTPDSPAEATGADAATTTTQDDTTVAVDLQIESDQTEANPSTPTDDLADDEALARSAPASIVPQSVIVYSAHVSVTVQVVDDDSSVIDWCNTRVDWGDGSVTRVTGADEAALCTASCEYSATSSVAGISQTLTFEHEYTETIDASPRVFVATGDGCSYTLAEMQLSPFTVVPLP